MKTSLTSLAAFVPMLSRQPFYRVYPSHAQAHAEPHSWDVVTSLPYVTFVLGFWPIEIRRFGKTIMQCARLFENRNSSRYRVRVRVSAKVNE